jgi:hypothetical protein
MPGFHNKRIYFYIGLLAIGLVYCLYNIYFLYADFYLDVPIKIRHMVRFLSLLLVYGIGTLALRAFTVGWMMQIWHLVYGIGFMILLLIGLYDWISGRAAPEVRVIANDLHQFLLSPIVYVVIGIVKSRLKD